MLDELGKVPSRAAPAIAEALERRILETYDAETNAYGRAWADYAPASRRRGRDNPMLYETGGMRDSIQVLPAAGAGVRIVWDMSSAGLGGNPGYPGLHWLGTRYMPARAWLPDNGMPATWRADIKRIIAETFKKR